MPCALVLSKQTAQSATMEPYAPYRQVFLTWTRPRIVSVLGISACPSRMMLGQPSADEGGCYVEEGKEEVPEKEEGDEEVPGEEEGKEEVPVPEEEEGRTTFRIKSCSNQFRSLKQFWRKSHLKVRAGLPI